MMYWATAICSICWWSESSMCFWQNHKICRRHNIGGCTE